MNLDLILSYSIIALVWVIAFGIAIIVSSIGFLVLKKAMKHDEKAALAFLNNIWSGIAGGLVVAMLLDLKSKEFNFFSYLFMLALIILTVSLFSYIGTKFYSLNKKRGKKK